MRNGHRMIALLCVLAGTRCDSGACAGAGGGPVPGGFPLDRRVENGAQLRFTPAGFGFLRENLLSIIDLLDADVLSVPIPPTTQSVPVVGDVDFCPDGGCTVQVTVTGLDVRLQPPASVAVVVTVQVATSAIPFAIHPGLACLCWEACQCSVTLDTTREDPPQNTFSATIALSIDAATSYTTVNVAEAAIEDEIQGGDIDIGDLNTCGLGVCNLLDLGFVKDFVVGLVADSLVGQIRESTKRMFCRPCAALCPEGSTCDGTEEDGVCVRPGGGCVPAILGLENRFDPSAFPVPPDLASGISPLDVLFGAGGYAEVDDGISLGFFTGLEPGVEGPCAARLPPASYEPAPEASAFRADAFTPCTPCAADDPAPCPPGHLCLGGMCVQAEQETDDRGLPRRCRGNQHCGVEAGFRCIDSVCTRAQGRCLDAAAAEPMLALGIARRSLDGMLRGGGASGALCLGVGTRHVPLLTTTTLAMLVPGLSALAWDERPVLVTLLPGEAPRTEIADWPSLTVVLPALRIEFHAWIHETYARILTLTGDLRAAVSVAATEAGLEPALEYLAIDGATVDDADLLRGDVDLLADVVSSLIIDLAPLALGTDTLGPIELPLLADRLAATVLPGGVRRVQDAGEDFLAVLVDLSVAEAPPGDAKGSPSPVDTSAMLVAGGREAPAADRGAAVPFFDFALAASGAGPGDGPVEYAYRIDDMFWSKWTTASRIRVADPIFLLDGRHRVAFRARVRGAPGTRDPTPAVVDVVADTHAPLVRLVDAGDVLRLEPKDAVAGPEDVRVRYRYRPGHAGWAGGTGPVAVRPPRGSEAIEVEATDPSGNTRREVFALRDGPRASAGADVPPPDDDGCGCVAPGRTSRGGLVALIFAACVAGAALLRRRGGTSGRLLVAGAVALLCGGPACEPGSSTDFQPECRSDDDCYPGWRCCAAAGRCVEVPGSDALCGEGYHCDADPALDEADCTFDDSCCVENPPLDPGRTGTYTSFVVAGDGMIHVAGYSEGESAGRRYGDLVVGTWNEASGVAWRIVDGVPEGGAVEGAPSGWRSGVVTPGDDVGLWTSAVATADRIVVFYYDRTHGSLKAAHAPLSGGPFAVRTVDDGGDAGTYASALLYDGSAPAVVYRAVREDGADPPGIVTEIRFARAVDESLGSFAVETVASAPAPCWKEACGDARVCRRDTGTCVVPESAASCSDGAGCATGERCVDGACVAVADWVTDVPPGIGVQNSAVLDAAGTVHVLYADRTQGVLALVSGRPGRWETPWALDGAGTGPGTPADRGLGPSLVIDGAGYLHAAYGDGAGRALFYRDVGAGVVETVYDGSGADGSDPRHVGFRSSIAVDGAGRVRIAFQDATAGRLLLAVRNAEGSWATTDVTPGEGWFGFWASQRIVAPAGLDDESILATYFTRNPPEGMEEGVRLLFCGVAADGAAACR